MTTRTLNDWLDYQLQIHPKSIDMGLDRISEVAKRLEIKKPAPRVITVAGTNGKGSTVAFIEAIARAAGWKVGAYTSPHILAYNERIRVDGINAGDKQLVASFEKIEAARTHGTEIPLTYFEFGTLAAVLIFAAQDLDLVILEVGLGGRLDATQIVEPDVAIITTVDLDHQDYLGADRESIGFEKAGIIRAWKPVIFGEKDPPSSALRRAYELGATAIRGHSDYLIERLENSWRWREPGYEIELPIPALAAPVQIENAAAAIAALRALSDDINDAAIIDGIRSARVPGRLQKISTYPDVILDVAHNPQAAKQLSQWLMEHPKTTFAVFAALADKDIEAIVSLLKPHVGHWFLAGIDDAGPRNLTAIELETRIRPLIAEPALSRHVDVELALQAARLRAKPDERVLVFGSFHTVAAAIKALQSELAEL
ncbi:MAG: bifunctional tetrahydrofolate synthase/dihydrofolate synthase [Arenimonas sp.]